MIMNCMKKKQFGGLNANKPRDVMNLLMDTKIDNQRSPIY